MVHTKFIGGITSVLFRFRLRTLLFFVLLSAGFFAWIGDDLIRSRMQRPVIASIEAAGGKVYFDYQTWRGASPTGSEPVRLLFGDDIYATVTCVTFDNAQPSEDDVKLLRKLPGLLDLAIGGTGITDACIRAIGQLRNLEGLHILQPTLTDKSMEAIANLLRLRELRLDGAITDAGFRHLRSLNALEDLRLRDTEVGDGTLATISQFERLKLLDLCGTHVSNAGLSSLSTLKDLVSLDITRTNVTNSGLRHLVDLPSLVSLSVEIETGITLDGVNEIKTVLPDCSISCWDFESDGSGRLAETR